MQDSRPHVKSIIVDSGAHSFFSEMQGSGLSVSVHTKKTITKDTPENYFLGYLQWLQDNKDYYDYFVELDIGEVVGQETVLKWREEIRKAGLYSRCITVFHPRVMDFNDYLKMLEDSESKFVALEGDRPGRLRLPYNKLIKPAYEKGIKVHGFAFIKRDGLDCYPFYSVDATSWKASVQYGTGLTATKDGLRMISYKNEPQSIVGLAKRFSNVLEVHSEDKKIQRYKRLEIAISAYRDLEKYYNELWERRGIHWN
jgi:hypothetical protein